MKILLDASKRHIDQQMEKYGHDFGQLRTPLTRYKEAGVDWAMDNGCFTRFNYGIWKRMISQYEKAPIWAALPDVVGDARRTMELFDLFKHELKGLPKCLVLQDGIGDFPIPWWEISAVFIGGSDEFKVSHEAMAAAKTAKILNKRVHVGRVNTYSRAKNWLDIADTIDGSGISKYDHMLEDVLLAINGDSKQGELLNDHVRA